MGDRKENTEQSCFTCLHREYVSGGASCRYLQAIGKYCNQENSRCAFHRQGSRTKKQMAIDKNEVAIEQVIFDVDE